MTIHEGIHFDLSFEQYQAADGISQSTLKEFGAAASPLHFSVREPKAQTPDMAFGTVCHAAVLTPDKFAESFHLKPENYPTKASAEDVGGINGLKVDTVYKPWNGNATACKAWLLTHADRPVMTRDDLERIGKIRESLTTSPKLEEFRGALKHGRTEVSFFKRDEETGLMLKCRTDLMATDAGGITWLMDLKKTQSGWATPKIFGEEIERRGYGIQAASYLSITGASKFLFIVFDDDKPFDAAMIAPTSAELNRGQDEWRRLLRAYAVCVKENKWPGYPAGIQPSQPPKWLNRDL